MPRSYDHIAASMTEASSDGIRARETFEITGPARELSRAEIRPTLVAPR